MKIKTMVSRDGYSDKDSVISVLPKFSKSWKKTIRFMPIEIELSDWLVNYILEGHTYCNLFNMNNKVVKYIFKGGKNKPIYSHYVDGFLKCSGKQDKYFEGSQIVTLDVDGTRFNDPWAYYDALLIKPTFVYTTFSDKINKDNLRKFRCGWVFDRVIDNIIDYKILCAGIYKMIFESTDELPGDDCGEKPSQMFHGTNKYKAEWRLDENTIYTPDDFKVWTDKVKISEITPVKWSDENMIDSMAHLDYQTFTHLFSTRYEYWYSTIRWSPEETVRFKLYGPEDFVLLNHFGQKDGEESKWINGEHRRKKIAQTARELLLMRPEATPDQVLYALYIWTNKFIEINEDITVEMLKAKVEAAFHLREDEEKWQSVKNFALGIYNNEEEEKTATKRKRYRYMKNPYINETSQEIRKNAELVLINKQYDPELSVYQNYEQMKQNNIKIGIHHLYDYCKAVEIETNPSTEKSLAKKQENKDKKKQERDKKKIECLLDQGILENIIPGLGLNKQLAQLREKGFKLSQELLITIINIYHL